MIKFLDKVRFKNAHKDLMDKDWCVLGLSGNAVAIIEWERRGEYFFEYYSCNPQKDLIKISS